MIHKSSKKRLKTICIGLFYKYDVFEIETGGETYLEAVPLTPYCVTRVALNEYELRKILDKDIHSINQFVQKIR